MKTPIELFNENQKLVTYVLKGILEKLDKEFRTKDKYDELQQAGLLGLHKASIKYDESRGTAFSTLAVLSIRNEIYYFLREELKHRKNKHGVTVVSLETPVTDNLTLADTIEYAPPEDVSWIFEDKRLDERQVKICRMLYEGYSQQQIGCELGLSQCQVSRMIQKIGKILSED